MLQGRWEEEIQHAVLSDYFAGAEKIPRNKIHREFLIEVKELDQGKIKVKISADFIIDRGDYYELIERKGWNHPAVNIGPALGQALVYRQLMEMNKNYPAGGEKPVKLGLCFVDGFKNEYGRWMNAHDELLAALAKSIKQELRVYLVKPREAEFAEEKYWFNSANYCVDPQVKVFK
ncbi:MAG: hypothetical protein HY796_11360 [Elusimicrobia bacterium]|nr:hypothetical protein [Elusimicrobiota bacterium]